MNLVLSFDKNAEAVCWSQTELVGDVQDEVPDPGVGRHLKYLNTDMRKHW